MPNFVWKIPVASPQRHPARNATSIESQTFSPEVTQTTSTAPPVPNDPSTVRSATSSILYVTYRPIAMIPQMTPLAIAPGRKLKNDMIFYP